MLELDHDRVQGMRSISQHLGADKGNQVVIIDTRQELSIYIGGHPYTRREVEMPTASMHHAGIHWRELMKLEQWLLEDTKASGEDCARNNVWSVLVHHEARVCALSAGPMCASVAQPPYPALWLSHMEPGAKPDACRSCQKPA
jgi:hypothetical protein